MRHIRLRRRHTVPQFLAVCAFKCTKTASKAFKGRLSSVLDQYRRALADSRKKVGYVGVQHPDAAIGYEPSD